MKKIKNKEEVCMPFINYFNGTEPKPTLEEIRKFFPSLQVQQSSECYKLQAVTNPYKMITLAFWEPKEIKIFLTKGAEIHWRKKIIHSCCEFMGIKDTLLNYIFADTRKVPEIYNWIKK